MVHIVPRMCSVWLARRRKEWHDYWSRWVRIRGWQRTFLTPKGSPFVTLNLSSHFGRYKIEQQRDWSYAAIVGFVRPKSYPPHLGRVPVGEKA